MRIECCDICKKPLTGSYIDDDSKTWEDVTFKERKYFMRIFSWHDSWKEWMSVCGQCRYELSKRGNEDAKNQI